MGKGDGFNFKMCSKTVSGSNVIAEINEKGRISNMR